MSDLHHPNWKCLPAEVLHYILKLALPKDLFNCALVCKAWLLPTQTLIYSNVLIRRLDQFEDFHCTVEHNPQLGMKVKKLKILPKLIYFANKKERIIIGRRKLRLLTTLLSTHLPNLEELDEDMLITYIPISKALTQSQLRFLRRIPVRSAASLKGDELDMYVSCALLLKDRLESITVTDDVGSLSPSEEQLPFNRLYNQLNQFVRLKEIHIQRKAEEVIQLVDDIVEICPSLKHIELRPPPDKVDLLKTSFNVSEISKFTPRSNIETVTTIVDDIWNEKMFMYILHKFPRLQKLTLHSTNKPISLNRLEQVLHCLSICNNFKVQELYADHDIITKAMGSFWDATTTPGSIHLALTCTDYALKESLTLDNKYIGIHYPASEPEWRHVDFLEKNGKFIKKVDIGFLMINRLTSERCILPDDFITHTFKHCPGIKDLLFYECILKKQFTTNPDEKHSLDNIHLSQCKIYAGALESLSTTLLEVKHLEAVNIIYVGDEEDEIATAGKIIMMPHTKVDLISLGNLDSTSSRMIKFFSVRDEEYSYYLLDHSKTYAITSTEEEYIRAEKHLRVEIWCQTKSVIKK